MDCGTTLVKYILFIFNILFVVCGILLIVFGSIMMGNMGDFRNFSEALHTTSIPVAVIVLGCIIFIISFAGCCGAIRENSCLTVTYSLFMLILLVLQMILVVYIWVEQEPLLKQMAIVVDDAYKFRHTDQHPMDVLQIAFNCCGKLGATDYTLSGEDVPNSCCGAVATSCSLTTAITKPGCRQAFTGFWETNTDIIRFAGLGVAAIELIAFIFGCCLANQIRNERRRGVY